MCCRSRPGARRRSASSPLGSPRHLAETPGRSAWPTSASPRAPGRAHFAHRAAVVGRDAAEMAARLARARRRRRDGRRRHGHRRASAGPAQVAFLFTGQGPQYAGHGRAALRDRSGLPPALDECAAALDPHLDRPLARDPRPASAAPPGDLDRARDAQPAMFAIEYALAAMWRAWGIEPAAVIGHSLGEYAAACVAGVFSLAGRRPPRRAARARDGRAAAGRDGRRVGVRRPTWRRGWPPHGAERVDRRGERAGAGRAVGHAREAIRAICAELERDGDPSPAALDDARLPLADGRARARRRSAPRRRASSIASRGSPIVSNVTGGLVGAGEIDAAYWARHARHAGAIRRGPRRACTPRASTSSSRSGRTRRCSRSARSACRDGGDVAADAPARRGRLDLRAPDRSARSTRGASTSTGPPSIAGRPRRRVTLPTYPFQRARYWVEPSAPRPGAPHADAGRGVGRRRRRRDGARWSRAPLDLAVGSLSGEVVVARDRLSPRLRRRRPRRAGLLHAGGRAPHADGADRALEPAGRRAATCSRAGSLVWSPPAVLRRRG